MDRIARELIAVARELVAVKSDFTVIKVLQLKKEGATRDSLENARRIEAAGYNLLSGTFEFDANHIKWETTAHFRRASDGSKATYVFKGFSIGYGGEGPSGMRDFLSLFGWGPDWKKISTPEYFGKEGTIRLRDLT